MGRILTISFLAAVMACNMASCSSDEEPEPAPEPTTPRTILVYMVAANNLGTSGFDRMDLDEMLDAARNGGFNGGRLLVYHAPDNDTDPQLIEITADGEITLTSYSTETSSTDPVRMTSVINDTRSLAPAQSYGLILWSHSTGWLGAKTAQSAQRSFGLDNGRVMYIPDLAEVLRGLDLEFIYADCCYMGGIEVVYELRDACRHFIGSVAEVPSCGMPYDLTLPQLFSSDIDYDAVARTTFNSFESQENLFDRTCTISVINCSAIDRLAAATREVYSTASPLPDDFEPQHFKLTSPYLYYDWEQYVTAIATDPEAKAGWDEALDDAVIAEYHTDMLWNSLPVTYHCGLSTYIVGSDETVYSYDELSWWTDVASSLKKQ